MEYVKCRVCGKVIPKEKLKDECPACGAAAAALEDFTLEMDEKRKFILDLKIHPILVHFPETIAFFLTIASVIMAMSKTPSDLIRNFVMVLGFIFPFAVLFAIAAGVLDAKIRFKKLRTKYLLIKIIAGTLLFLISLTLLVLTLDNFVDSTEVVVVALSIISFLLGGLLGKIGGEMVCVFRKDSIKQEG